MIVKLQSLLRGMYIVYVPEGVRVFEAYIKNSGCIATLLLNGLRYINTLIILGCQELVLFLQAMRNRVNAPR